MYQMGLMSNKAEEGKQLIPVFVCLAFLDLCHEAGP